MKHPEGATDVVRTRVLVWIVPFLLIGTAAATSYRITRVLPPGIASSDDRPTGSTLLTEIGRRPEFAFGFRSFLADAAWLEAIQVAGMRRMRGPDYDRLHGFLQTVVRCDPRFFVPYVMGGIILAESPLHRDLAIRFLEQGRIHFPGQWLLPFHIGYIRYFGLSDPTGGGQALKEAAAIPGCPPYIGLLATRMLAEGREPETALALLDAMIREEKDPGRRELFHERRAHVEVERDLQILERAVASYRAREGRNPSSLEDLLAAGILGGIPREPGGGLYRLDADGTVRSGRYRERVKVILRK